MRTAVLLTCFNRKEKTLNCLSSLKGLGDKRLEVFLVDDGSSDGTAEAVKRGFPDVNIINGNGNLFWSRGMLKAWESACQGDYDYYLWINDDVELLADGLAELFECSRTMNNRAVISGLIEDKITGKIIYGGYDNRKKLLGATGELQDITYLNGNVVLIPKIIPENIGLIDAKFHHDLGDVEYGLRAIKNGYKVVSTRRAIAYGYSNEICRERKNGVSVSKRFKILYSPLGSNPYINYYFRNKYQSSINASLYFLFQHFLNLIPDRLNKFLFSNKYV
ncbi:glycosyltransferase family 2 protein [Leeuwenhoekiella marinoflava]|uniref:glycosyltransferase family 2 protein n=1 Tax=Leeuwenhoekiella marinoflava TaxID=988 RepID=UPI0030011781